MIYVAVLEMGWPPASIESAYLMASGYSKSSNEGLGLLRRNSANTRAACFFALIETLA
jgi:hypothetical protein